MPKRRLGFGLAFLLAAAAPAPPPTADIATTSVFVVAHEDDWQLFMNPDAFRALDHGGHAVFVHLTAGDAGRGTGGAPVPYYRAREEGALRALRFVVNVHADYGLGEAMTRDHVELAGHSVLRVRYGAATAYFLRLPDGNGDDGLGYPTTGLQSLERLRTGQVANIGAIDGSAQYTGWSALVATLSALVAVERGPGIVALHAPEPDARLNPNDHVDHRATGLAVQAVAASTSCARLAAHDEYDTGNRPVNMRGEDLLAHAGVWGATNSALSDNGAPSTWNAEHNSWIGRSYARAGRLTAGCADVGRLAGGVRRP